MGRELKRVSLDFTWPLGQVWEGFLNPYSKRAGTCPSCVHGYTHEAKKFQDQWYGYGEFDPVAYGATPLTADHPGVQAAAKRHCDRNPEYFGRGEQAVQREANRLFNLWRNQWTHHLIQEDVDALAAANRLWDFTRVPRTPEQVEIVRQKVEAGGNSLLPFDNGHTPTAEEVNAWSLSGMGHDSCNEWVCVKARCEREGFEYSCGVCAGTGEFWSSSEDKNLYEAWEPQEPPHGEGFQLWGTTSEGEPLSPVFQTLPELCAWCESHATTFADHKVSAETWAKMLTEGFVHHREGNNIFL